MPVSTHMVPMRDGTCLATDVYLPDSASSYPVILERTPYGRAETSRSEITAADRAPASRAEVAAYSPRMAMWSRIRTAAADTTRKASSSNT